MPGNPELMISERMKREKGLGESTLKVFKLICTKWPLNPFEIAKEMGEKGNNKTISAKYLYHMKKLKKADLIEMKKLGNTYIAWPIDIEKLRLIHELLKIE
jgi:predicted transcriptional regulator